MIRILGQKNGSHDPKLKLPFVASECVITASERTVSTGEMAALRKEIAVLTARVVVLEARNVECETTPRRETHTESQSQSHGETGESQSQSQSHKSHVDDPWKAAGVSRSTWFRRQKANTK